MKKRLPTGAFVIIRNLPAACTDASVAAWLALHFPTITEDRVAVLNRGNQSSALVSFDNHAIAQLMSWTFDGCTFPGSAGPLGFDGFRYRSEM